MAHTLCCRAWSLLFLVGAQVSVGQEQQSAVFSALTVTSDYRFNSASASNNHPAIQGYAQWWRPDGYLLGVFISTVDFNDPNQTAIETDIYAGRTFRFNESEVELQLMYLAYDENVPGPTYDFWQAGLTLKHPLDNSVGRSQLIANIVFSPEAPYGAGDSWQYRLRFNQSLNSWLRIEALAGYSQVHHRVDGAYWEFMLAAEWTRWTMHVGYVDTSADRAQCGGNDSCAATWLVKLERRFDPWTLP